MILEFGYGKQTQTVNIPGSCSVELLRSNDIEHERLGPAAVRFALEHPIAKPQLRDCVRPDQRIVIVTSDISRPLPSYDILPTLLDELYAAGCSRDNITIVLARGSHRKHTAAEMKQLVGERAYNEVSVVDSNTEDCVHLGTTKAGTPADFDRRVAEADFRICLGNVEFHYFAGYSGGYKALMPGVSTPAAIQCNHKMMILETAHAGKLEGNPLREDIEEAGAMLGVDYIINCVLDEHKKIVYAAAGDVTLAHRDACAYLDRMYRKPIAEKADIVIVSQGGAPKDANLYQTQKALDNAKHAVKEGGTIILIGACSEGFGNPVFEEWISSADSPAELVARIKKEFRLGGHKAAAIAMVLEHAEIYLVSELSEASVQKAFMLPAKSAQEALDRALEKHGSSARIIAIPYGGAVLPILK